MEERRCLRCAGGKPAVGTATDLGFSYTITSGSLVVAIPIAVAAGAISFASPCTLPLLPGYLSYVSGLSGVAVVDGAQGHRRRLVLGATLFVVGFSAVFIALGVWAGAICLSRHPGPGHPKAASLRSEPAASGTSHDRVHLQVAAGHGCRPSRHCNRLVRCCDVQVVTAAVGDAALRDVAGLDQC
jgi:hypothetical protein